MAEEPAAPTASGSSSATMADDQPVENAAGNTSLGAQTSIEATIESNALGGAESTCNNDTGGGEASAVTSGGGGEENNSLEFAEELKERGTKALKEDDFEEAVECFSRALEIRVKHYGELAPECITAYYHYGRALLFKAQEESDPLGSMPKKEDGESKQVSGKDEAVKIAVNGESSTASASSNVQEGGSSSHQKEVVDDGDKEQEDDEEGGSDDEETAEADEDESDLDLAWKMLDLARAIAEKHSGDTMDKVDVLSALGEVALEREDIETSLADYKSALSILERIVESDSRLIAELNFRICLCLEVGSMAEEAIPYCQKAISVCKARLERLTTESKSSSESAAATTPSAVTDMDEGVQQSSTGPLPEESASDKEAEIETLTGLSVELEKKVKIFQQTCALIIIFDCLFRFPILWILLQLEDLQQLVVNPKSILQEILGMASARARGGIGDDQKKNDDASPGVVSSSRLGTSRNGGDLESPTVSTAHTNGGSVTNLGVVGRGVKRVLMSPIPTQSSSVKKPAVEPSSDDGNAS
ncbi:NASP-related protein sim3 [Linum perenne]